MIEATRKTIRIAQPSATTIGIPYSLYLRIADLHVRPGQCFWQLHFVGSWHIFHNQSRRDFCLQRALRLALNLNDNDH